MRLGGSAMVVTGGAGFIGSHLVERLLDEDPSQIVVVDDLSTGSVENVASGSEQIRLMESGVTTPEAASVCADADIVFHLAVRNVRASLGRPIENFDVNAVGTLRVLEAMRGGRRGRFVYVSSSEVYGIPEALDFTETTVPRPTTVYGAGKLAGEHVTLAYHRTYGLETVVIRPFNNFGPRSHFEGDSGEVIPKFILRALAGRPLLIHGDGSQTRDFMFVRDTADWLARLGEMDGLVGQTVNIGTGIERSVADLAGLILEATNSASTIEYGDPRPGDLPRLCADITKVRSLTEFALPTSFEAGLAETIDHFAGQNVERLLEMEQERTWT